MAGNSKAPAKKAAPPKAGKAAPARAAAKPAGKPAAKAASKPTAKPAKPVAKAAHKPISKPVAKSSAKAKPAVKAAAKPVAKPTSKPTGKPTSKPTSKPVSKPPVAKSLSKPAAAPKPAAAAKPAKAPSAGSAKPTPLPGPVAAPRRAPIAAGARPVAAAPTVAAPTPMPAPRPMPAKPQPAAIDPKDVAAAHEYLLTRSATRSEAPVTVNGKQLLTEEQLLKMPESAYMNEAQLAFFRYRLQQMERELLSNADETTEHLRETVIVPDPADRATIEEEHALELRTRDRERKLLKKVQQSLARIDSGDYGFCEETGDPIGIPRLLARPTATLSLEAQQRRELKQKLYGD